MTEQYVIQELVGAAHHTPYYFASEKSTYGVDFLVQNGGDASPVEVKSEDNLTAKSLKYYCEKYAPSKAIRTSASNHRAQSWMENIPLWAIGEAW